MVMASDKEEIKSQKPFPCQAVKGCTWCQMLDWSDLCLETHVKF